LSDFNGIPDRLQMFNILPLNRDSKYPATAWQPFQSQSYPVEKLKGWQGNFVVVCGKVENGELCPTEVYRLLKEHGE